MKATTILAAILLGLVVACSPKIHNQSSTKIKDSLVVHHVTIYDTTKIKKSVAQLVEETTDSTFFEDDIKVGQAEIKTVRKHGRSTTTCTCDSMAIVKKLKTPDSTHYITKITENTGMKYIPVTSSFDHFCEWWFFITAGVLVSGVAIRLAKLFR